MPSYPSGSCESDPTGSERPPVCSRCGLGSARAGGGLAGRYRKRGYGRDWPSLGGDSRLPPAVDLKPGLPAASLRRVGPGMDSEPDIPAVCPHPGPRRGPSRDPGAPPARLGYRRQPHDRRPPGRPLPGERRGGRHRRPRLPELPGPSGRTPLLNSLRTSGRGSAAPVLLQELELHGGAGLCVTTIERRRSGGQTTCSGRSRRSSPPSPAGVEVQGPEHAEADQPERQLGAPHGLFGVFAQLELSSLHQCGFAGLVTVNPKRAVMMPCAAVSQQPPDLDTDLGAS